MTRGFAGREREIKGDRESVTTGYTGFASVLCARRRHVLSGEDTGKRRHCRSFDRLPVFSTCSLSRRSVIIDPWSAATFLVRVMRSKLGETSREAMNHARARARAIARWLWRGTTRGATPRRADRIGAKRDWIKRHRRSHFTSLCFAFVAMT